VRPPTARPTPGAGPAGGYGARVTTPPPDWPPDGARSPLDDKLGVRVLDWNPDRLVGTMPVAGNEQPFGLLHGGATCTLAETIGSMAAAVGAGPDRHVVGIELNVSYLRAATSGTVTAVCTPVRRGRTLATFLIQVTDDQGRPTATARLTTMTLPERAA
jgi:1,4-dihydroxy-2-naphthoyl-CoA hydrolase